MSKKIQTTGEALGLLRQRDDAFVSLHPQPRRVTRRVSGVSSVFFEKRYQIVHPGKFGGNYDCFELEPVVFQAIEDKLKKTRERRWELA